MDEKVRAKTEELIRQKLEEVRHILVDQGYRPCRISACLYESGEIVFNNCYWHASFDGAPDDGADIDQPINAYYNVEGKRCI